MTNTALKAGATVKPDMRGAVANHWAHGLRGTVVEALLDGPIHMQQILVKWDYEARGLEPLAAYWMLPGDVEVIA